MRDHVLIIDRFGGWRVLGRINAEPHPRLLCQRIEHAAGRFMEPLRRRHWWQRYRGPVGAFWVGLDDGNLHIGGRLTHVEQVIALGGWV